MPQPSQKSQKSPKSPNVPERVEHFDVLIVGAGISGVGGAKHLRDQCPGKTFVVLDALESYGGTWLTHKYPGIRSDSDLYTFGYRFKPWTNAPIASAEAILDYMGEVIAENGLAPHIRYRHWIDSAAWSSQTNLWTVDAHRTDTGERFRFTTRFLWMCQGYYDHAKGHTPEWKDMALFRGTIVHPQSWPADLDYENKQVLVIGSGATTATVVPAIAAKTAHTTVLQRSPTYFLPAPNVNELADLLRTLQIDETWIHEIVRRKILHDQDLFTKRAREESDTVKKELLDAVRAYVGDEEVERNFTPKYRPWQQRLAFVPEGDLFKGILAGKASVVTDEIDRFTEKGVLLKSGRELVADIIVTATGFDLSILGNIAFTIDGEPLALNDTITYRGMMFTGVPNLLWIFGYFRASWTLRVDLLADFVCRLLNHMDRIGAKKIEVALRPEDEGLPKLPWIDPDNFNPSYLMRAMNALPKRLDRPEWQHTQDYWREKTAIPAIELDGKEFVYR
ncbi:MAG: NAD(P)/FAD-dependent oxidoreductase [Deltaproteobacteria bacterium]|nr:NAD(P)/FAD-dependent oxidoreductase [Deltaproteobacteria bacterium]